MTCEAAGDDLLKPEEVAKQFKLSVTTIYELIQDGEFPNATKLGRFYRIPASDVRDCIECGTKKVFPG